MYQTFVNRLFVIWGILVCTIFVLFIYILKVTLRTETVFNILHNLLPLFYLRQMSHSNLWYHQYSSILNLIFGLCSLMNAWLCTEQCYGLTYEDVKTAGSGVEFSPMELFTLKQEDLEQSLVYLGKDSLSLEQASSIWKALVKVS